jgi:DNA-binding response OmpR family regulator
MTDAPLVLAVEDDGPLGELVEELLADDGYRCQRLATLSAEAVLDAVVTSAPAVVLLDGAQPSDYGTSWETARQLRGQVPVVMFTANAPALAEALAGTSARAVAAGFAAIVAKPFDLNDLLATVARLVHGAVVGAGADGAATS